MSRNGAGTYTLPAGNPVVTGTTISSTWANNSLSDIATALTQSLAKDGQTTPTANIPLGGFKITGLGAPTTAGDALAYGSSLGAVTATTGTFSGNVQMASQNGGQLAGLRNKIINGDMRVAQRGANISLTTSGQYSLDRWISTFDGSGATRAIFQQAFPAGTGPQGLKNFLSYAQSVAGTGGTFTGLAQYIEGVDAFAGQTVTLSFYARNNASTALPQIICRQFFGSTGSATVNTTVATSVATTSSFSLYTYSFTVPSIVGKTVSGGNDYLGILILLPINSVFTFDITGVQLEVGPVATPFEQRPYGMELALCQRYYEVTLFSSVQSTGLTGNNTGGTCYWKVDKRAVPTITQIANNVAFTQQNVSATTSTYLVSGLTSGVTIYRTANASNLPLQFSETLSASAEL
jgi:hypothetical protein